MKVDSNALGHILFTSDLTPFSPTPGTRQRRGPLLTTHHPSRHVNEQGDFKRIIGSYRFRWHRGHFNTPSCYKFVCRVSDPFSV
ncbi:hypothetical protein CEXT_148091 [Caerostris extrusa]|uniref:Uncharacterized protein n=1 Tax=Caerostris extrusa TaxID=172846 RepID=A0AAV4S8L6_CAEEX|nr:hypothetical protein CEXT_148091 [Caerostris extrusa]